MQRLFRILCSILVVALVVTFPGWIEAQTFSLESPNPKPLGNYGSSVAGLGDLNGNGWPEVLVGAPNETPFIYGRAYVQDSSSEEVLFTLESGNPKEQGYFGTSVAALPDLTGDGVEDWVVGAPGEEEVSNAMDLGRAYVFDGSSGAILHSLRPENDGVRNQFGTDVLGPPDLDGDGRGDIAILASGSTNLPGSVHIFSGSSGLVIRELVSTEKGINLEIYSSLALAPDTNGDAVDDLLVGIPGAEGANHEAFAGKAVLYDLTTGNVLHSLSSPNTQFGGNFGASVAGLADITGDGRGDLLIAAPGEEVSATDETVGRCYAFNGANGDLLYAVQSEHPVTQKSFGITTLGMPDIDGDGFSDFAVGSPEENVEGAGSGRTYLFSGRSGERIHILFPADGSGANFGNSLSLLDDANSDGTPELLIGDERENRVDGFFSPFLPPIAVAQPLGPIDFGVSDLDSDPSPPIEISISNHGVAELVLVGFEFDLTGPNRRDFVLDPSVPPASIPTGATLDLQISFLPETVGAKEAILTFHTNDPDNPKVEFQLSGEATQLEVIRSFSSPNPEEYGRFGHAVDSIPDLNGNGSGEAIVGAWLEDPDLAPANAGRVYVLDASTGETIHTLSSPNEGVYFNNVFGHSVAAVPDTNGDGVWDILVGAYYETQVFDATSSGSAYLFDGASGELLHSFFSPNRQFNGWFGWSVDGIPDVNGDGRGDVIIGADREPRLEQPVNAGMAYVFDGASGDLLHELKSPTPQPDSEFGFSVTGVPDLDGDGLGDVAVGAYLEDPGNPNGNAGRVYVFSGSSGDLVHTLPKPEEGHRSLGQLFGYSVEGFSDLNGDGRGEIAVGAPQGKVGQTSPRAPGVVYLFDGASGRQIRSFSPPTNDFKTFFGRSVTSVPDTNLDGFEEILVGSNLQEAILYDTKTGDTLWNFNSPNPESNAMFSYALAGLPDANGDGRGDILIGAQNEDPGDEITDAGRAYAFYSPFLNPILSVDPETLDFGEHLIASSTPTLRTLALSNQGDGPLEFVSRTLSLPQSSFTFAREPDLSPLPPGATREFLIQFQPTEVGEVQTILFFRTNYKTTPDYRIPLVGFGGDTTFTILRASKPFERAYYGNGVAGVSDLDGDGLGEVAVGSGGLVTDGNGVRSHRIEFSKGDTGSALKTYDYPVRNAFSFGPKFAAVPDTTFDGIDEIVLGVPYDQTPGSPSNSGLTYLADGASGAIIHTVTSIWGEWQGLFGSAVSGIPDTNGDGCGDFVVGAFAEDPGSTPFDVGRAYVFDGSSGVLLHELYSIYQTFEAYFGQSVAGAGDINGDGYGDVIVGAPGEGIPPYEFGRVYVFDGALGELYFHLNPPHQKRSSDFGAVVCGIPDVDGDGLWDVGVSAPNENLEGVTSSPRGRVYVYSGKKWNLLYTLTSPEPTDRAEFGVSLAGLPDVTGDGLGELIVGADADGNEGRVYLFDGATGAWLKTYTSPNRENGGRFGQSVAAVPDANGDGLWDFAVGAPSEDPPGSPDFAGRAYVFYTTTPFGLFPEGLVRLIESMRANRVSPEGLFQRGPYWMWENK